MQVIGQTNGVNFQEKMCAAAVKHFLPNISKLFSAVHPIIETVHDFNELHEIKIIKHFTAAYTKIRLHAYAKTKTIEQLGTKATMRQKLTRLVIFNNV